MSDPILTFDTLESLFYDLAKVVPVGVLNKALLNSITVDEEGIPLEVHYCDEDLATWAREYARQIIDHRTKFTRRQLEEMGFTRTVSLDGTTIEGERYRSLNNDNGTV